MRRLLAVALVLGLAACASAPKQPAAPAASVAPASVIRQAETRPSARKVSPYAPAQEDPGTRGDYTAGGLYKPGVADSTPDYVPDVELIPEPEVVAEPRSRAGNRSTYSVLGKQYRVLDRAHGYVEQGQASYYGKKFHGRRTSNLEVYDMNAFTAAHKTLPLPSFARVTNLDNGKSVVVRVNDRGPFHAGRIVDLSYAAAVKLGITQRGTGRVEVRALSPGEPTTPGYASAANNPPPVDTRVAAVAAGPAPASRLDTLITALPVASAGAVELPPGVRIATGRPTRLGAAADATGPAPAPADIRADGRTMTADEFEASVQARQTATGRPGAPAAAAAAADAVADAVGPARADDVILQVASFSARDNADRALAMLHGAGIDGARLLDAHANGQQVWRLRVGPLDASAAPQLAHRIAGLGFGPPQRVRD